MVTPKSEPQLIIVFGKSGAGKTFIDQQISKSMGFHFYDGDSDLTQEVKDAISANKPFTPEMRDRLYSHLVNKTKELLASNNNIVFSQALFKNEHRKLFFKNFPKAKFVWVDTENDVIAKRLKSREGHISSLEYAEKINPNFEAPVSALPVTMFANNDEGLQNLANFLQTSELNTLTPQYTVERYRSYLADGAKEKINAGVSLVTCPKESLVSIQHIPDFVPSLDLYAYKPNSKGASFQPVYIYLPASFVGMNPDIFSVVCKKICALSQKPVVAFKYPLSPEASLSAQISTTTKAYEKLLTDDGALGLSIDKHQIALGGYSSGGYLALHIAKNLLTKNIPSPTKLLLPFPVLDVSDKIEGNAKDPIVKKPFIDWLFFQPFVNESQPIGSFSLLSQDFTNFPSMTIITSNWDYSLGHVRRLKELNAKAEICNMGDSGHADFWYDPEGRALTCLAQTLACMGTPNVPKQRANARFKCEPKAN
ncbi:MAG: alpha/beta hydrolase fold domain-containing protein [Bdellovibrionales bacterium]